MAVLLLSGFCGETEYEHDETLDLLDKTRFDSGFLFKYSERSKTHAARHLEDDVPESTKGRRLSQIISLFRERQLEKNKEDLGRIHVVSTAFYATSFSCAPLVFSLQQFSSINLWMFSINQLVILPRAVCNHTLKIGE